MFKGGVQRRLYFCAQRFEMSAPDTRGDGVERVGVDAGNRRE
jgi:hypothetical protein